MNKITNILIVGLGGQGIILASNIICDVLFREGFDVKKSEVHGMSQRGGSVVSHIRYGTCVYSPLIPEGKVDFLIAMNRSEGERNMIYLNKGGTYIHIDEEYKKSLPHSRTLNIALAGIFFKSIGMSKSNVTKSIRGLVKQKYIDLNIKALTITYEK
ncbi:indolepyruvate oxidoreductase subunit beta [Spirochaetota bacterium]